MVIGAYGGGDRALFKLLVNSLLTADDYMLLADYQAYVDCLDRVSAACKDQEAWTRMSILNVAASASSPATGRFATTARRSGRPGR